MAGRSKKVLYPYSCTNLYELYSTFLILVLLVVLLVGSKKSIEVGVASPALLTADEYSHSLSGSIVD
jgi:hypothetical protein